MVGTDAIVVKECSNCSSGASGKQCVALLVVKLGEARRFAAAGLQNACLSCLHFAATLPSICVLVLPANTACCPIPSAKQWTATS